MVLAMAMPVRSMDVVGRSAFKQRFETMASTYVITSDIELNETLVFDSETGKVILKGSPPQNNMSYSVIFGSREASIRPIVVQDVELNVMNIHFSFSRVVGAIMNIKGQVKLTNCMFTDHMMVPGGSIYTFGGITVMKRVIIDYPQTVSGCCIFRPYDPRFPFSDYQWTKQVYAATESNIRIEVTDEELHEILLGANPTFKSKNVEYTTLRIHY